MRSGRGSTRTGRPAALPDGRYEASPVVEDTAEYEGFVVRFEGEDGRKRILRVDQLPLPGWHRPLAVALAVYVGPSGYRRTYSSVGGVWGAVGRVVRFLHTLPDPPESPPELTVAHLKAFQRFRSTSSSERAGVKDLGQFRAVLDMQPLSGQVRPDVLDHLAQRSEHWSPRSKPGYSDREFGQMVSAARADVANIRNRIRAGERLLARRQEDPDGLDEAELERAAGLEDMARTGQVPVVRRHDWLRKRLALAGQLFITRGDVTPFLVLFVAVTERNVETIKELPTQHRILEDRAVELRIVKRRRGARRWYETVTWEIGKPGRELHTPGGLYLLAHELSARSRGFSGTKLLWSVWHNGHNTPESGGVGSAGEHYGMFDEKLERNLYASDWAASHGLTADPPASPDSAGEDAGPVEAVPLLVEFNRLKTSADVRRTRQMGGHLPSAARSNTFPVLFRNYLRGDPTVVDWAHEVVGDAVADAEQSAVSAHRRALEDAGGSLRVVSGPADAQHLEQAGLDADTARKAAEGELDTAWTECVDHDHHPATGMVCRASFLDCFQCGNCLVTRNDLPRLLSLLDALAERRQQLSEAEWWGRYGMAWAAIRKDVVTKFSPAEVQQAEAVKPDDALLDVIENPWERP